MPSISALVKNWPTRKKRSQDPEYFEAEPRIQGLLHGIEDLKFIKRNHETKTSKLALRRWELKSIKCYKDPQPLIHKTILGMIYKRFLNLAISFPLISNTLLQVFCLTHGNSSAFSWSQCKSIGYFSHSTPESKHSK